MCVPATEERRDQHYGLWHIQTGKSRFLFVL